VVFEKECIMRCSSAEWNECPEWCYCGVGR